MPSRKPIVHHAGSQDRNQEYRQEAVDKLRGIHEQGDKAERPDAWRQIAKELTASRPEFLCA
jgi:hypothetical protein